MSVARLRRMTLVNLLTSVNCAVLEYRPRRMTGASSAQRLNGSAVLDVNLDVGRAGEVAMRAAPNGVAAVDVCEATGVLRAGAPSRRGGGS